MDTTDAAGALDAVPMTTVTTEQAGLTPDRNATIRDLLTEWAQVEPKRCIKSPDDVSHDFVLLRVSDGHWECPIRMWPDFPMCFVDEAMLQAKVQEAIEARGWQWNIERLFSWPQRQYSATVIYWNDGGDPDNILTANLSGTLDDDGTAAEALLGAYLRAIKATSK